MEEPFEVIDEEDDSGIVTKPVALVAVAVIVLSALVTIGFVVEPSNLTFPVEAPTWATGDTWTHGEELRFDYSEGATPVWVNSTEDHRVLGEKDSQNEYRVRRYTDFENGDENDGPSHWRVDQDTLAWDMEDNDDREVGYPFPLSRNETGTIGDWKYRVARAETISVAAGSYSTVRVEYQRETDGRDTEMTKWYAPELGRTARLVMSSEADGSSLDRHYELRHLNLG